MKKVKLLNFNVATEILTKDGSFVVDKNEIIGIPKHLWVENQDKWLDVDEYCENSKIVAVLMYSNNNVIDLRIPELLIKEKK